MGRGPADRVDCLREVARGRRKSPRIGSPLTTDARRRLPAMDQLLARPAFERLVELYGRPSVKVQAGAVLQALRAELAASGPGGDLDLEAELEALPARVEGQLRRELGAPLRRVLNATGVLIHTNLGRSPLPAEVARALPALLD